MVTFNKAAGYKINTWKSLPFLSTSDKEAEKKSTETTSASKVVKHPEKTLARQMKDTEERNWNIPEGGQSFPTHGLVEYCHNLWNQLPDLHPGLQQRTFQSSGVLGKISYLSDNSLILILSFQFSLVRLFTQFIYTPNSKLLAVKKITKPTPEGAE